MNVALPAVLDYPFGAPPPPGELIAIAPRIGWMRMPLPFALDHINLWVLEDDDGVTLVDCGFGDSATRALWDRHFATNLDGARVRRIIATHCHPDHVGNAAWLSQRFSVPVRMTPAEYLTAHALAGELAGYSVRTTLELFRRHGLPAAGMASLSERGNSYRRGVPELPQSYDRMQHGDVMAGAGTTWQVIEGYGHSPAHASLYSSAANVLIAGDMLLPKISTNVSVWTIEPDGNPLARFLRSLDSFDALPTDTLTLPSHGLPFRGIHLRVAQLRAHHEARLAEIEIAMRESGAPMSAAEIVPVLFRRELDAHQLFFALGEAIAHLNYLWHAGRIERLGAADGMLRFAAAP